MNTTGNSTGNSATVIYPDSAVKFAFACCILLIFSGCAGNLVTILALLKSSSLRRAATSVFVVSLCFTDFLFSIFNLPLTAVRYWHKAWVMGELLCELFPFAFYLNVAASLYHIMAISINRYVLIAHHAVYDKIYREFVIGIMIAFCWGFPFCLLLPTLFGHWGEFGYNPDTFSCTILKVAGKSPKKFLLFIGILPPCVVTAVCYAMIYSRFRKSKQTVNHAHRVDNALTRIVLVIFCTFLACYGPLILVNVMDPSEKKAPWAHVLASVLAWCSAVANPIIYSIMNKRYRKAYFNLLPRSIRKMLRVEQFRTRTSDLSTGSSKSSTAIAYNGQCVKLPLSGPK